LKKQKLEVEKHKMVEKKVVELLVGGGQATAGPPLGPALGPLGINTMAVVTKINELTKDYAGMKVPVKVAVDLEDKTFEVTVGTPTASALIVSELKIEKGSGTPNTEKVGDLTMEQVVRIAKIKAPQLLAQTVKNAAKEMLGTCVSMGVTIEGKDPREVQEEIDAGNYDELFGKSQE
jgi:large subunit ribosomal protein L11